MPSILFICHGNICRSTMAEFVMKELVRSKGLEKRFHIESAGTSREETGSDTHPGTRAILSAHHIPYEKRRARQVTPRDYGEYDLLIGMERINLINMKRLLGPDPDGKMRRLLDYTDRPRDIQDPWYSGDFETTYDEVTEGCEALLEQLIKEMHHGK